MNLLNTPQILTLVVGRTIFRGITLADAVEYIWYRERIDLVLRVNNAASCVF